MGEKVLPDSGGRPLFSSHGVTAGACCSGAAADRDRGGEGGGKGSEEIRYIVWYIVRYIVTIL
eukprot:scaffold5063_cov127-Isochrysis_galbana.AAC.2